MEIEDSIYAGLNGVGQCTFTSDGEHVLIAGQDGSLKVLHKSDNFKEPDEGEIQQVQVNSADELEQAISSIAITSDNKTVVLGAMNNMVKLFTFPSLEFNSNLTRLTCPVTAVAVSSDDQYVAIGADDSQIHVFNLSSREKLGILQGHNRSIKSLSFDPKGTFLASSSEDGTVKIWNYNNKIDENAIVKTIANIATNEIDAVCRINWSPDGKYLCIPGSKDGNLNVVQRNKNNWEVEFELSGGHTKAIDVVHWSYDGKFILTGGMDFKIHIWNAVTKTTVKSYAWDANFKSLRWSPDNSCFAVFDEDARFAVVPFDVSSASDTAAGNEVTQPMTVTTSVTTDAKKKSSLTTDNKNNDNEDVDMISGSDDEDDDAIGINARKLKRLKKKTEASAEDGEDQENITAIKQSLGVFHTDEERDDATEKAEARLAKEQLLKGNTNNEMTNMIPDTPYQSPFQSACTPMSNKRRFLTWNAFGTIISRDEDTHKSVEIEFADVTKHRNIRLTDHFNFHVAALGEQGAFFASRSSKVQSVSANKAKDNPSTVFYRPIESWSHNAEWLYSLPSGEEAVNVAVGTTWAAVATNRDWVRVFRYSGVQEHITILPGSVVSMTGCNSLLAICYHRAAPHAGQQNLGYMLLDIDSNKEIAHGALPLSADSELDWFGFDFDTHTLYASDSAGLVTMLSSIRSYKWIPMLDMADESMCKSFDAYHWIVSIVEGNAMLVVLRGGENYPPVLPRPLLTPSPLKIPLLQLNTKASKLEEKHLRASLKVASMPNLPDMIDDEELLERRLNEETVKLDQMVLQMINIAAQADRQTRALDLANRLQLDQSFNIAVTIAQRASLPTLAERLDLLRHARLESNIEENNDNGDDDDDEEENDPNLGYEFSGGHNNNNSPVNNTHSSRKTIGNTLKKRPFKKEDGKELVKSKRSRLHNSSSTKDQEEADNTKSPMAKPSSNPFARSALMSPIKRTGALKMLSSLKSPGKIVPKLSRDSSFSQAAREQRSKKKHDKRA